MTDEGFTPLDILAMYWPSVIMYDKQKEMIMSVRESNETYVVAANEMGKDYVSGFISLSFFMFPEVYFTPQYVQSIEDAANLQNLSGRLRHTRRIVTNSVRADHLGVLWAEIAKFRQMCISPEIDNILLTDLEIRFKDEVVKDGTRPNNYLVGIVSDKAAGLAGHHGNYTLGVVDEASGSENEVHEEMQGWAKRKLIFGNPRPCNNFFKTNYRMGMLKV